VEDYWADRHTLGVLVFSTRFFFSAEEKSGLLESSRVRTRTGLLCASDFDRHQRPWLGRYVVRGLQSVYRARRQKIPGNLAKKKKKWSETPLKKKVKKSDSSFFFMFARGEKFFTEFRTQGWEPKVPVLVRVHIKGIAKNVSCSTFDAHIETSASPRRRSGCWKRLLAIF